jgi:hypothetical protein
MAERPRFESFNIDWEMSARAQGLACVVCKDTPTELDRETYFATGLCLPCSQSILAGRPEACSGEFLER